MTQEEIELEVLRTLGKVTNQRTIGEEIGYSAGKVNYVLKKLVEKGLVKVDRFVNSKSKVQYKYLLTPEGIKCGQTNKWLQDFNAKIGSIFGFLNTLKTLLMSAIIALLEVMSKWST